MSRSIPGQTLVELALVFPLFVMTLFGIVVLGLGVFYSQQVTNAAREAARFAAIHSATAVCPTVSRLDPKGSDPLTGRQGYTGAYQPLSYTRCDSPDANWPMMTPHARSYVFGLDASQVRIAACWSGYVTSTQYDAPPPGTYDAPLGQIDSTWAPCSIGGSDPMTNPSAIPCNGSLASSTVDRASDISEAPGRTVGNRVVVYACYDWRPPLAGFLLIPDTITLRGVVSEAIQRQQ
ncbi:MAG TPA: TadE family protein [Mycobacterium sp.]|nr:TadE family protein [Mycobacterium sp.]